MLFDILTELQPPEAKAFNQEMDWLDVIAKIPAHFYIKDRNGRYLYLHDGYTTPDGMGERAKLDSSQWGKRDDELRWKDYAGVFMANDQEVMRTGKTETYVEVSEDPSGVKRRFVSLKAPARNKAGKIIGV